MTIVPRRLLLVPVALVVVLVLAGQLARAAARGPAVPNDPAPVWAFDEHDVAFTRVEAHTGDHRVWEAPAGVRGRAHLVGAGNLRGWRPGANELLLQTGGRTEVVAETGTPLATIAGTDASWSPDGARIAFERGGSLYAADARGGGETLLASGLRRASRDVLGSVWSPDGAELAVASVAAGGRSSSLLAVAADGSGTRTVFSGPGENVNPSWSPDGRTLAFESDAGGRWRVLEAAADGSGARTLPGAGDSRFPQFSPSGVLALISDRQHIPGEASRYRYALYVDGTKVADDVHPASPPRWSPSGTRIAVAAAGDCHRFGIELVDPAAPRRPATRASNLCRFVGGAGNDVLHGTAFPDFLRGLAGNDHLFGGAGSDRIEGNSGNDVIVAGAGNDAVFGGPGNDRILGGPGNDLLTGGPGHDTILGGPGNDRIEARDGVRDVVDCGPGRDVAEVDRIDVVRHCETVLRP